jgi:two-component system, NtrC family, nitrogen regulation sensor histidine kinase NtrY
MATAASTRTEKKSSGRKKLIYLLAVAVLILFAVIVSQTSFDLPFLNPDTNQQIAFFAGLSLLIFLLFLALTFVLARNLLKLSAERRLGVLGSKFRTRLVIINLLLSFLPVITMFLFAYGLMNRTIDKWFSRPVEEVRQDTAAIASLLSNYTSQNARAEALSIASSPVTQHAFAGHSFSMVEDEFRDHETTLQGGFAVAILDGNAEASFAAPAAWLLIRATLPSNWTAQSIPERFVWDKTDYMLGTAPVGEHGLILVGMPLPPKFSETLRQVETGQQRYFALYQQRRVVRRTYMELLFLLTALVLFTATWLALFLSKLVTRPVVALAEAMQEISRGRLDYRVEIQAADEIGDLVTSFNRMAGELEVSRKQTETSRLDLQAANIELEERRQHIETILESIPNGVLSLDADRTVTRVNHALLRLFHPLQDEMRMSDVVLGATLKEIFPTDVIADMEPLLRRADRMGSTTTQMEILMPPAKLNVALTVATLEHAGQRSGYVLVFEDLSDLLRAQKQAAWREVAQRVAHEIKNPLTPISLSAQRILRHLNKGHGSDRNSEKLIRDCAKTIGESVETVRKLANEFSTLARFPAAQPQPSDINLIIENTLSMFNGRLDDIRVETYLSPDIPKVMADPEAIKRALANLVDNAAEAMQDAMLKKIQISTSVLPSYDCVEITVADTGHGVTQETKERLFLPYFSTKQRGTGLGLAIVSRIVEDHRGSIRVEENKPLGTKFILELPLASNIYAATSHHG